MFCRVPSGTFKFKVCFQCIYSSRTREKMITSRGRPRRQKVKESQEVRGRESTSGSRVKLINIWCERSVKQRFMKSSVRVSSLSRPPTPLLSLSTLIYCRLALLSGGDYCQLSYSHTGLSGELYTRFHSGNDASRLNVSWSAPFRQSSEICASDVLRELFFFTIMFLRHS